MGTRKTIRCRRRLQNLTPHASTDSPKPTQCKDDCLPERCTISARKTGTVRSSREEQPHRNREKKYFWHDFRANTSKKGMNGSSFLAPAKKGNAYPWQIPRRASAHTARGWKNRRETTGGASVFFGGERCSRLSFQRY